MLEQPQKLEEPMKEEFDLRYIAGFFDGEGSISLCRSKRKDRLIEYVLMVSLSNTYYPIVTFLKEVFDGSLFLNTSAHKKNPNHRPVLQWTISGKKAKKALERLLPFLVVKKEQAVIGIAFQEFKSKKPGGHKAEPERFLVMQNFKDQLQTVRDKGNRLQDTWLISRKDLGFSGILRD